MPEHGIRFMQLLDSSRHRLYVELEFLRQLLLLGAIVRHKFVQRRIDQPDGHWKTVHRLEDADKVAPLKWQQLIQRSDARFFGVRENHFLDGALPLMASLGLLEVREE